MYELTEDLSTTENDAVIARLARWFDMLDEALATKPLE